MNKKTLSQPTKERKFNNYQKNNLFMMIEGMVNTRKIKCPNHTYTEHDTIKEWTKAYKEFYENQFDLFVLKQ